MGLGLGLFYFVCSVACGAAVSPVTCLAWKPRSTEDTSEGLGFSLPV